MKTVSRRKQIVVFAFEKGYRIKNNKAYSPSGKELFGFRNHKSKWGYQCLQIYTKGFFPCRSDYVFWHQLVAFEKFGDTFLDDKIVVRHLNGNHLDNSWDNIAIGSPQDNSLDRNPIDRKIHALKTSQSMRRFTDKEIEQIKIDRQNGMSYNQLIQKYSTSKGTLSFLFNHALYYKFGSFEKTKQIIMGE